MHSFPAPALRLVEEMTAAAAREPGARGRLPGRAGREFAPRGDGMGARGLPLPCFSFEDALDAVKQERAGCAIIPIENSLHGRVADIHFLLPESGLSIIGEHFLPIRYALMAAGPGTVRGGDEPPAGARPDAANGCASAASCRSTYPDTAGAAALVAETRRSRRSRAIAPPLAADTLRARRSLAEDIADASDNTTRFVDAGARAARPARLGDEPAMTTFIFEVKNIPAALYKALGGFATNGVNMTKLESYQSGASFAATDVLRRHRRRARRPGDRPRAGGAGVPLQGTAHARDLPPGAGAGLAATRRRKS